MEPGTLIYNILVWLQLAFKVAINVMGLIVLVLLFIKLRKWNPK